MIAPFALLALAALPAAASLPPTLAPAALLPQRGGQPAAPQGGGGEEEPVPPIQVTDNAYIINFAESATEQDEGMTLEQFVKICQVNTGINFTYTRETADLLRTQKVRMFGTKVVPKEDFYTFFQIMMIINRFVCTEIGPEHLAVVQVQSLDSGSRNTMRGDALYVEPEELSEYADQPATLITTVLNLPNTDVRTLSNSMRTMVVDPNTLTIIPVGNSQSLILTGFGSNIAALARMLNLVDIASTPEEPILPEFHVMPLEFATADELAETIEELLEASRRAASSSQRGQQQQGATAPLQQGTVETKILVDQRSNALLIMAMPEDMPNIKELVARLDVDVVERERMYHFVSLENADAESVAEVLEDFLQDASRVEPSGPGGQARPQGATTTRSSSEVAVVPDPATNALLIAASRSRYEEIADMIDRLDRRQDQVLIETALIELTGRDFLDIGIELGGADLPGVDETGGFGVSSFGLSTFADNDQDGIPDSRVPITASGITAGILDGDNFSLPILVQALKERRNTNVLNIPSVLVNNNGSASVQTIDEQPTTDVTGIGTGNQTSQTFGGYESAGITMQISPTISSSSYLRLSLSLEVSSFLGTVQGAIPPPKITRTLNTTVNVPDGDTMVIGGIIVDNKQETSNRVPLLGDIPILGRLFRRDSNTEDRTTLYFFVTPHIMHDREFADLSAWSYKKKLEAADSIGARRVRLIDPGFGERDGTVDLSGFDVPLYQPPPSGEVSAGEVGMDPQRARDMLKQGGRPNGEQD